MALEQGVVGQGVSAAAVSPSRGVAELVAATAQMPVSTLDRAEAQLAAQRQQQQDFAQTLAQTRQMLSAAQARGAASDWRLTEIMMGAAVLATLLVLAWVRWRSSQTRAKILGSATKFSPSAFDQALVNQLSELPSAPAPIQESRLAVTPPAELDGEVQKVLRSLAQKRQARTQPVLIQPAIDTAPSESFGVDIELEFGTMSLADTPADPVSLLLDLSRTAASTASQPEPKSTEDLIDEENISSQWEANLYLAQELEKLGQHDEASSMYQEVIDHGDPTSRKEANSLMHAYPRVNKISD